MLRIRLGIKDRERLGVPEVMEYDLDTIQVRELRELHRQVGWEITDLDERLRTDNAHSRLLAQGVLYWLACLRSGARVSWEEFDCDLAAVEFEADGEPDPNPPAPDGAPN